MIDTLRGVKTIFKSILGISCNEIPQHIKRHHNYPLIAPERSQMKNFSYFSDELDSVWLVLLGKCSTR